MILEQIKKEQLISRKNREAIKASLLTTLIGEIEIIGKNNGNRISTDEECISVIKKFLKNNSEFQKVSSIDVLKNLQFEEEILKSYLPKQLSELELKEIILKEFGSIERNQKGFIMKFLKDKYSGQYDGSIASKIIG